MLKSAFSWFYGRLEFILYLESNPSAVASKSIFQTNNDTSHVFLIHLDHDQITYIDTNKGKLGELDGFTKKYLYEPALMTFLDTIYKNLKMKRPPYRSLKAPPRLRNEMNKHHKLKFHFWIFMKKYSSFEVLIVVLALHYYTH